MTPEKIKLVAAHALSSVDGLLSRYLPDGKREGHEYLPLNPKRSDSSPGSFSINLNNGKWADFADGAKGNDLVSLFAYLNDCTQSEAAKSLAGFLNIQIEKNDPSERATRPQNDRGNGKALAVSNEKQEGGKDYGWVCVMPVPDNAPKPPQTHPRHGKPSARYDYLNINGKLNFYHDRYNKPNGEKKQFSPLTLWQKGSAFKWLYKSPPEPRPLYGLPGLAAFPDADCWIVEGEKAAIALEKLLPNHPVLTWQGGSNATAKADFRPLKNRNCIIFQDNDAAGMKACKTVIQQLQAVNAASVRALDISKLERAPGQPLQPGDDADDLVAAGWTAEQFADLLQRDGVMIDAPEFVGNTDKDSDEQTSKQPEDAEAIERFTLFDRGLYVNEQHRDGSSRIRWVCSPIKPLAMVRTEQGLEWGLLVWLIDPDAKEKRIVLGMRQFNGDALGASGELLDAGLRIGTGNARKLVIEYLQTATPDKRAVTTNKTGWHGVDDEMVFVLPEKVVGESQEKWLYANQLPDSNPYRQKGSLAQWRDNVAALCAGNSRLVFSVCTAFASPLLHLLGAESGGFQLTGNSSTGKSTALFVASSVCGGRDYLQRWRSTDNGLEALAQSRSDSLLVLDEVKQLDGKIAAEAAYMLANSSGKVRSNANGGARNLATWRILFLSSGELSLSQHVNDAGKRVNTGMEIRLCDLPVDAGTGMGIFENIHGYESPAKLAEALAASAGKYYGTALLEFIRHVLKNKEAIPEMLRECEKVFAESVLTEKASGQTRRVAARFALAAAGGELATLWGVTGWKQGEAINNAVTCFKAWLAGYGGEGNKEERDMLAQVRHFLELHSEGRFVLYDRADDTHAPKTLQRCGYRKAANDGTTEYYVLSESFKKEICKGVDYRNVARLLIERGYMRPGDGKNLCPKVDLPHEGRVRAFHILPSIWSNDDDG
ncbi:Uncharcterized protein, DUF927 family [Nitrosomonas sp. Nm51]|uniref:DUF927 domain-containing protein n=1 Tax=Nitrosomonas sp. Nm51 TaxID=133720 RepID=UPI0008CB371B|nr:DUF927 domain-containing protein [Nitrosomonas sp. Nm51]SER46064.1 Uncharcterized protein, DUF927 family [Nitrosomonas sp. Nm51]